ncbi:uncharacterized protein LOC106162724 [Lingula anatina]|uniref:Uncharacterized protein LOC106162724 n=1 Tax=Lingula anatina TaxID=7574 RepID=A0A1S3IBE4_LINAN|nr:uncharacterized protein LOC106162724 [Lingula anatina]|eukprot:XP_013395577.1 uncharacterized protein LOC106162724 [Lingula anatina]
MPRVKEIKTGKLDHMKRQNYFKPRQVQFCKVIEGLDTEYYLIKLFRHDDKLHRRVPKGSIQFNKADVCAVHMWEAKEEKKKLLRSQVILKNHVILFLPEPVVFLEKSSDESLEALELLEWYNCFVKEFKHRHHWEVEVPEKDYYKPGQYWLHLMEQSLCLVSRSNLYGPCDPVFACYDHYSLEDVEVSWSPGILDLNVYDKQQIKLKTPFAKDIYNVISEKTAELSAHKQSDVVKPVSPTTPFPPQRPDGAAVSVKVEPPDCPPTPPLRKDVESPLVNPDINASIVPPRPPRSPLHTRKDANLDKDMSLDNSEEDFKNLSTENVHRPLQMSASIPYSVEAIRPPLPPLRSNSDQSGLVSNFQTMPPPLPPRTPCKKSDQQKSKPSDLSSSYHDVKAGKKWQNVVVSTEEEQGKTNEMILNIPVQSFDQNVTIPCSPKTPSPTLTVNPKGSKKG